MVKKTPFAKAFQAVSDRRDLLGINSTEMIVKNVQNGKMVYIDQDLILYKMISNLSSSDCKELTVIKFSSDKQIVAMMVNPKLSADIRSDVNMKIMRKQVSVIEIVSLIGVTQTSEAKWIRGFSAFWLTRTNVGQISNEVTE